MIKAILFAALAACGVTPTTAATVDPPAEEPGEFEPTEVPQEDSHWCCQSVDPKTKSGEGCTAISGSLELINACPEYLYCSGDVAKHDGKTYCL